MENHRLHPRVDEDYFDLFNIQLIQGTTFKGSGPSPDHGDKVIVSEALVKAMGWENPLEEYISNYEIAGVVHDFNFYGLQRRAEPMIFRFNNKTPEKLLIKFNDASRENLQVVKSIWTDNIKGHAFSYRFLDEFFPYPPGFDISVIDQIGVGAGSRSTIFNPMKFARMEFAYAGISVFDKDTVAIIEYFRRKKAMKKSPEEINRKYNGVIYVAINNLAIVRHTLKMGTSSELDIIYKRAGGQYFPYSIRTQHPMYADRKRYSLVQTVSLRNIRRKNVKVIEQSSLYWYPEDVEYNKEYWDEMFDPME